MKIKRVTVVVSMFCCEHAGCFNKHGRGSVYSIPYVEHG